MRQWKKWSEMHGERGDKAGGERGSEKGEERREGGPLGDCLFGERDEGGREGDEGGERG